MKKLARPIPLPREKVIKLENKIILTLENYLKSLDEYDDIPNFDLPSGFFDWKNVLGETISVQVRLRTKKNGGLFIVPEARIVARKEDWMKYLEPESLVVYFNQSMYLVGEFRDKLKYDIRREIHSKVIHELTHALDLLRPESGDAISKGVLFYVNLPEEVRAHMAQIIEEVLPSMRAQKIIGKRKLTTEEVLHILKTKSSSWKNKHLFMSPETKKKILKSLVQVLDDYGLV
jgi:hypothetical protein